MATNIGTHAHTDRRSRAELEEWLVAAASLLAEIEIDEAATRYEKQLEAWKIGAAL